MLDSVTNALQEVSMQPVALLLAMLLGTLSAASSACCALPAMGILVGYSGAQADLNRNLAFKKALFFTLGTIIALMILGGVAGFVGRVAQASLGRYWQVFAGVAMIFFGLATLQLLPFKLPTGKFDGVMNRLGKSGTMLAGLVLGGVIALGASCCSPGIFVVVGVAVIQKHILWAVLLLGMFAIGFSLPLGAILLGVSLSKASFLSKGADTIVRWIAGGILMIVGFYVLITL